MLINFIGYLIEKYVDFLVSLTDIFGVFKQ